MFEKGNNIRAQLTRHEKNGQDRVVLDPAELQIIRQMERLCVGNVDTIEKGQQVQQADEGQNVPVDARHHLFLGRMRRTHDTELVVLVGTAGSIAIFQTVSVEARW